MKRHKCRAPTLSLLRLFVVCLLGPICSAPTAVAAPAKRAPAAPVLVWPRPPDPPRITYVRSIEGPADLGIKRSTFGKVADWMTGSRRDSDQLIKPFGIALDEKGNLCFTDTGANVVCFFDRTRKLWRRWEKVGKVRFVSPVAVAKRGPNFYVADSVRGCVVVFNEKGEWLFEIHAGLQRPAGLTIVGERLFVVDSQLQGVLIFDLRGRPVGQFGRRGAGEGEFNFPTHISADPSGTSLLVTDSMNSRIQFLDLEGRFLRRVGSVGDTPGHFSRPKGTAIDSFGHLYVIDANYDNIQLFDREGRLLMDVGETGSEPGEFWIPNGIAISRDNEIYVTDSYNKRIQVFKFIGGP